MALSGLSGLGGLGGLTRSSTRPVAQFPVLSPEEEESLLSRIMGTAMGGLQYVGETLDKPGAAVRGLLAGQPDQLLNLIPFSDSIGITDPSERVYGRDLLEKAGFLDKNQEGLDLGDVAGFGVDVLTDPLSYMNPFGALTKGGRVAERAGILDQLPGLARSKNAGILPGKRAMRSGNTLDELIGAAESRALGPEAKAAVRKSVEDAAGSLGYNLNEIGSQRLGGSFGFSMGPFGASLAPGGPAGEIGRYGRAMDALGGGMAKLVSPATAALSRPVRNQRTTAVQRELQNMDLLQSGVRAEEELLKNQRAVELTDIMQQNVKGFDPKKTEFQNAVDAYMELGDNYKNYNPNLPDLPEQAKTFLKSVKPEIEQIRSQRVSLGSKSPEKNWTSEYDTEYFPRLKLGERLDEAERLAELDVPGGKEAIERLLHNPQITPEDLSKYQVTSGAPNLKWMGYEGRREQFMIEKGYSPAQVKRARQIISDVNNGDISLRDLSPEDVRLTEDFRQSGQRAKQYAKPYETGDTTRENLIAQELFGVDEKYMQQARRLEKGIKKGTTDPQGRVTYADDPFKMPDTKEAIRMRDQLNRLKKVREVDGWLKKHSVLGPSETFYEHPLKALASYKTGQRLGLELDNATHNIFSEIAVPTSKLDSMDGYMRLDEAFKTMGFEDVGKAYEEFMRRTGGRLGDDVMVPKKDVEGLAKAFKRGEFRQKPGMDLEKQSHFLLDWFDTANNLFKMGATFAPAFHVRNKMSGTIQNWLSGAYSPARTKEYEMLAYKFSRGDDVIEGLAKHKGIQQTFGKNLTDAEATKKLREAVEAYDLRGSRFDEVIEDALRRERADAPQSGWERLFPDIMANPGNAPIGVMDPIGKFFQPVKEARKAYQAGGVKAGAKELLDTTVNPKTAAGVWKDRVPVGTVLKEGEKYEKNLWSQSQREVGRLVEDMNRVGALVGYLDQGMNLKSAMQRVKATHVDYKNLSDVDRKFIRRLMPFYSFFKGISTNTAKELVSHPGGVLAQTMRASNSGRAGGAYTPDYIGEGLAIPLGDRGLGLFEGQDKYLARLGLMHEAPFEAFAARMNADGGMNVMDTIGRTLQKVGSMGTPYAKLPTEIAFDKQLFTGRSFKDLYPYPLPTDNPHLGTDIPMLTNVILGASPLSRPISTARKLTDERKSIPERILSTTTGLGLTDVYGGAERAKELDAMRRVNEQLESSPRIREYSTKYAPKDLQESLTPTERALLRLQRTQNVRRREAAKERAQAGGA